MRQQALPIATLVALVIVGFAALSALNVAAAAANKTYVDPDGRFSFEIPPGGTFNHFRSDETTIETLVASGGDENFQITISPWKRTTFTEDDLLQEFVGLDDRAVEPITVDGEPGFTSEDFVVGKREVWFVSEGYLYQFMIEMPLPTVIESLWLRGVSSN